MTETPSIMKVYHRVENLISYVNHTWFPSKNNLKAYVMRELKLLQREIEEDYNIVLVLPDREKMFE